MKTKTDDPFDMGKLALTPDQITELAPFQKNSEAKSKRRQSRPKCEFVMLPYEQTLVVAGQTKSALLAVLLELAHQMFKTRRNSIRLTNTAFRSVGISHHAKLRALRQLAALGLVEVAWQGSRRSPMVTILWG